MTLEIGFQLAWTPAISLGKFPRGLANVQLWRSQVDMTTPSSFSPYLHSYHPWFFGPKSTNELFPYMKRCHLQVVLFHLLSYMGWCFMFTVTQNETQQFTLFAEHPIWYGCPMVRMFLKRKEWFAESNAIERKPCFQTTSTACFWNVYVATSSTREKMLVMKPP